MRARVHVLFARDAPAAVILRRGPSAWVQMLRWDTRRDVIEPGQWLRGRVYERRCDLSPDGTKVIYFAMQPRKKLWAWTAISKPPFFTALALWPKGDCWAGGGLFETNWRVRLNHGIAQSQPEVPPHRKLQVIPTPRAHGENWPIYGWRLERDGWVRVRANPMIWEKRRGDTILTQRIDLPENERAPQREFDQQGRVIEAREGMIFADGRLVADLNGNTPERVAPPDWATRWL